LLRREEKYSEIVTLGFEKPPRIVRAVNLAAVPNAAGVRTAKS
jgi:hypothetical protein